VDLLAEVQVIEYASQPEEALVGKNPIFIFDLRRFL